MQRGKVWFRNVLMSRHCDETLKSPDGRVQNSILYRCRSLKRPDLAQKHPPNKKNKDMVPTGAKTYQTVCNYKYNSIRNSDVFITERVKFNVFGLERNISTCCYSCSYKTTFYANIIHLNDYIRMAKPSQNMWLDSRLSVAVK